jgi:hypothetical protein
MPKLINASSRYGAPMGRMNRPIDNDEQRFYLQRLKVVDGDYDQGGAYWGFGRGSQPVYRYMPENLEGEGFVRAKNRKDAKAKILERYPRARFFN